MQSVSLSNNTRWHLRPSSSSTICCTQLLSHVERIVRGLFGAHRSWVRGGRCGIGNRGTGGRGGTACGRRAVLDVASGGFPLPLETAVLLLPALVVLPDPRAKHSAADRKAQFELSVKLSALLGEMSAAVDRINDVRLALDDRSTRLPSADSLVARLVRAEQTVDSLRRKIVATKEGGMITGEERLRENLADLYGGVTFYDGRPSKTQIARTTAIGRELSDVSRSFDIWVAKELPGINSELVARKLPPIPVLTP